MSFTPLNFLKVDFGRMYTLPYVHTNFEKAL